MIANHADERTLADVQKAQRVINHSIAESFATDVCQDEQGKDGFCYTPRCFADRSKRATDSDAA